MKALSNSEDLSLNSWNYDVPKIIFERYEDLNGFVAKCQPAFDKAREEIDHDRTKGFIEFYQAFKAVSINMKQFYLQYPLTTADENNNATCADASLKVKRLICEELRHEYPDISNYLYFSTCVAKIPPTAKDITDRTMEIKDKEDFSYFVDFYEHTVLTLNFVLNDRIGFIIFEIGYGIIAPAIVFLNNPYTVEALGGKGKAIVTCLNERYVEIHFKRQEVTLLKTTIFVGGSFQRLDLLGKLSVLHNIYEKHRVRNKRVVASIEFYPGLTSHEVKTLDEMLEKKLHYQIPNEYFLQSDERNKEYENAISRLAHLFQQDQAEIRALMTKLALIQQDTDFVEQLYQLKLSLQEDRKVCLKPLQMQ